MIKMEILIEHNDELILCKSVVKILVNHLVIGFCLLNEIFLIIVAPNQLGTYLAFIR